MRDAALREVDDALVRLRRLNAAPRVIDGDPSGPVEFSSVLVVEAVARSVEGGREASVGDVAAFADVAHSTASRFVERAVRARLVVRASSAHDRRRRALALTDIGTGLRHRALSFRRGRLAAGLAGWPRRDVEELARLLPALVRALVDGNESDVEP